MATVYGNKGSIYWRVRLDYTTSQTDTTFTINTTMYFHYVKQCSMTIGEMTKYVSIGGTQYNSTITGSHNHEAGYYLKLLTKSVTYNKTTASQSKTVTAYLKRSGSNVSSLNGTSSVSATITIPALQRKTLTYNAGEDIEDVTVPAPQYIYGTATEVTLSEVIPLRQGYDFKGWNTAPDGSGTDVVTTYTFEGGATEATIYAKWHESYVAPQMNNIRAYRVSSSASGENPEVLNDGTRVYFDCDYTPPQQIASVDSISQVLKLVGKDHSFTVTRTATKLYGYTGNGALGTTEKDTVELVLTVIDYDGNTHIHTVATYISSESYIFDAFKGIQGDEEYQSFAIGTAARDFNAQERSANGDFDVAMNMHVNNSLNVGGGLYIGGMSLIDIIHPVGSTYITETNANPEALFGGTWALYGKMLREVYYGESQATSPRRFFTPSAFSTYNVNFWVGASSVSFTFSGTLNKALNDTVVTLGTINIANLGLAHWGNMYVTGFSDAGNAGIMISIANDGVISVNDVIDVSSVASGNAMTFSCTSTRLTTDKLDNACDKFFWRRTA